MKSIIVLGVIVKTLLRVKILFGQVVFALLYGKNIEYSLLSITSLFGENRKFILLYDVLFGRA